METLFDLDTETPVREERCRDCVHIQHRRNWWGGLLGSYCGIKKSGRTENGLLKIKGKDIACSDFESARRKEKGGEV